MRTAFLMIGTASFIALATGASHAEVIVTPLETFEERMIIAPASHTFEAGLLVSNHQEGGLSDFPQARLCEVCDQPSQLPLCHFA